MPTEVEGVIKKSEGQKVEFKDSLKAKKEIGETVSAFSNTNDEIILTLLPKVSPVLWFPNFGGRGRKTKNF